MRKLVIIGFVVLLTWGSAQFAFNRVDAGTNLLDNNIAPGLDVVVLLENRDDANFRNPQDFGELDPQASRYDAIRFLAQFLIEDSLRINPEDEHWLQIVSFDEVLFTDPTNSAVFTTGLTIDPESESDADALLTTVNQTIVPPDYDQMNCSQDVDRCGARFNKAFQQAESLLANRPAAPNRDQLIIVLTFNGCSGSQCLDQNHNNDMVEVVSIVDRLAEKNVFLYVYPIFGSDSNYPDTGNRLWELVADDSWLNTIAPRISGEVEILPHATDYLPRIRSVLRDHLDFSGISSRDMTVQAQMSLNVTPYSAEFTVTYLKESPEDQISLTYNNPADRGYEPVIERRGGGFFDVLRVTSPPPGAFWTLNVPSGRGEITVSETPGHSELQVLKRNTNSVVTIYNQYHPMAIRFTPYGDENTVLRYQDSQFTLRPKAVISNSDASQEWTVPLVADRTSGEYGGSYQGNFYPVLPRQHTVRIEFDQGASSNNLILPDEQVFRVNPITFDLVHRSNRNQFLKWEYDIVFLDQQSNTVPLSDFAPEAMVRVEPTLTFDGKPILFDPPRVDETNQKYTGSHTFQQHGEYTLDLDVIIESSEGANRALVEVRSEVNEGRYTFQVEPDPLNLAVSRSQLRQYDMVQINLRPTNISSTDLEDKYGIQLQAIITHNVDDEHSESWRIPLNSGTGNNAGFYTGEFYPVVAGLHEVTIEGVDDNQSILLTQGQAKTSFNAEAITIGLIDIQPAEQFQTWNFTIALQDSNGRPLRSELAPGLAPQPALWVNESVAVPFNSLTPIADAPGQWQGSYVFNNPGEHTVQINATGRPPTTLTGDDSITIPPTETDGVVVNVGEIMYQLTPLNRPTQFQQWDYALEFYNVEGTQIPVSQFNVVPQIGVSLRKDSQVLSLSAPTLDQEQQRFSGSYVFRQHGDYSMQFEVSVAGATRQTVTINSRNSETGSEIITVAPAPLSLEVDLEKLSQYDTQHIKFRPNNITSAELASDYEANVEAVITLQNDAENPLEWRVPLTLGTGDDMGYFVGEFYPIAAGKHHVTIEGRDNNRVLLLTQEQVSDEFTASPVTIGFIDKPNAEQFQTWNFTIALLKDGVPLQAELDPNLSPRPYLAVDGREIVAFEDLTPVAGKPGQWQGTYVFTLPETTMVEVKATAQSPAAFSIGPIEIQPKDENGVAVSVGEITYNLVANAPTQFEQWPYTLEFFNPEGERVPVSQFVNAPQASISLLRDNSRPIQVTQPVLDANQIGFGGSQVFRWHGNYTMSFEVTFTGADRRIVAINRQYEAQNQERIQVAPAPLVLKMNPEPPLHEYQDTIISFRPSNITSEELNQVYGPEIIADVQVGDITWQVPLTPADASMPEYAGEYVAMFYPIKEGEHTITVRGIAAGNDVLLTPDQAPPLTFRVDPVTITILNPPPASQFQPWDFTIALLVNGEPLRLTDTFMPQPSLKIGDGDPLSASELHLNPVADFPGQWTGTYTFTQPGDLVLTVSGTGEPPQSIRNRPGSAELDPSSVPVTVNASTVTYTSEPGDEVLVFHPITVTLDALGIGNNILRNQYGLSVRFVFELAPEVLANGEANDETNDAGTDEPVAAPPTPQRWVEAADAVTDPAEPFGVSFVPTIAGNYVITPEYASDIAGGGTPVSLATDPIEITVRPMMVAVESVSRKSQQRASDGSILVEINEPIELVARFYDGQPGDENSAIALPPTLPVTIIGSLYLPGAETPLYTGEFDGDFKWQSEKQNDDGVYQIKINATVTDPKRGASVPIPWSIQSGDGMRVEIVDVEWIVLTVNENTELDQYTTNTMPFSNRDVVIDIDTSLRTPSGELRSINPVNLFPGADTISRENWFEVEVDEEILPRDQYVIAFPEGYNGFQIRLADLKTGQRRIKVRVVDPNETGGTDSSTNSTLTFGVRRDSRSFVEEDFTLSRNPIQTALYAGFVLVLILLFAGYQYRRFMFQRRYAIPAGTLVLEDEYGTSLWTRNLADAHRATQIYKKSQSGITGWGRAMLDSIRVENKKRFNGEQVRITVKQRDRKMSPFNLRVDGTSERQQLPGARQGFYLCIKRDDTDSKG